MWCGGVCGGGAAGRRACGAVSVCGGRQQVGVHVVCGGGSGGDGGHAEALLDLAELLTQRLDPATLQNLKKIRR